MKRKDRTFPFLMMEKLTTIATTISTERSRILLKRSPQVKKDLFYFISLSRVPHNGGRVGIPVAEDQRTAYIGLVGGVLSIVVLLLGTGLVVFLRRRKSRHGKQVAVMLPGGGSSNAGLILNKMPIGGTSESRSTTSALHHHIHSTPDKRMTLLSLKQLGKTNSLMAPSARDGFYGPVMTHESDSDTSSFYHEPYQHNSNSNVTQYPRSITFQRGMYSSIASQADPEYGCLIQKEPLVLTPKGLHSTNVYHKNNVQTLPPAMPLPRPPLSMSLLRGESVTSAPQTTSFVNPPENYYAITDIIHVSHNFKPIPIELDD